MGETELRAAVLGSLEVTVDGHSVELTGTRAPQVLAYLLLHSGSVVPVDRLIDAIWGDDPPTSARNSIQRFVSDLRRTLGDAGDRIETSSQGYRLQLRDRDSFDLRDLEARVTTAASSLAAGDPAQALADLGAVPDPRHQPLTDLDGADFVAYERPALVELVARACEIAVVAALEIGAASDAVLMARKLLDHSPHREPVCIRLAHALAAAGRQGDALDELAAFRVRLRDDLGLDPSPALAAAERAILDPELAALTGDLRAQGWADHARSVVALNERSGSGTAERRSETFIAAARRRLEPEDGAPWWSPEWERAYRRLGYSTFGATYPDQVDDFELSAKIFESLGDEAAIAIHHAQALHLTGQLDTERLMQFAQRGAKVTTSPMWSGRCQSRIGLLHQRLGEHEAAITAFERACHLERAVGGEGHRGESRNIVSSLVALGRGEEACASAIDLPSTVSVLTSDEEVRRSLTVAALVLVEFGCLDQAAVLLGASAGAGEAVAGAGQDPRLTALIDEDRYGELRAEGAAMQRTQSVVRANEALQAIGA